MTPARRFESSLGHKFRGTLARLRWKRILEEETKHFLRRIRPLRIRIGAGRAASGPGVAGTVDIPVLQDLTFAVGMGRVPIVVLSGYLPAMHLLLRPCRSDSLFDMRAVVGSTVLSRSP
jgi:hypothetical protein